MAVKIKSAGALNAVPLTPMIDVVFQLLIFFLVATQFAEEDRELDVQLPTASEAQPLTVEPREMFVNIDERGQFFLGTRLVDEGELEALIQRATVNNPLNQSIVIRADKRVAFQYPVTVMNICNKAGAIYTITTEGNPD